MINFFAIILIIFIVLILFIFKKRKFKNAINIKNISLNTPLNERKIYVNYKTKNNSYSYKNKETQYSISDKTKLRKNMFKLFQNNTEDKLKALKIAEVLADKSTLPILRRGLKDTSPEVVEFSAVLIERFK